MKIAHYKNSRLAWAPDELSFCINKYSNHESYVNEKFNEANIIQYHNKYVQERDLKKLNINLKDLQDKPSAILYHSFPEIVDNYSNVKMLNNILHVYFKNKKNKSDFSIFFNELNKNFINYFLKKKKINQMVIGQYQATLNEYNNYPIFRNIIDYNKSNYKFKNPIKNKIKIGYAPSITTQKSRSIWENKGYKKTILILENLSKKMNIEFDLITKCSLEECLYRKSACNIIIDECVTSSFHRSGLEGLALGKLTICSLDKEVTKVLSKSTGTDLIPFENIWINDLEEKLIDIINMGTDYIIEKGNKNRLWMEEYWNPIDIVNEYIDYYKKLIYE